MKQGMSLVQPETPRSAAPSFAESSTPTRVSSTEQGATEFALVVPDGYRQGRGAFGGLVMAALTRAVDQVEASAERRLRSVSGAITAPVTAGESLICVSPVRIGSGVSTWQAVLQQGGEVRALATLVYGKRRVEDAGWSPPPPDLTRDWAAVEVLALGAPMGPEFAQHFEFRNTGPAPFSGGTDAIASGWIRNRPALKQLAAADVLALVDAWWPASFVREQAPRPMATLAYTAQLLLDPALLDGEPLYYQARTLAQAGGYAAEFRELWTARGELVALNQQTFVIIR